MIEKLKREGLQMDDVKVIDIMNYPMIVKEIVDYDMNEWAEWRLLAQTTFKPMMPTGKFPRTAEEYKALLHLRGTLFYPYETVSDLIKDMDKAGYDKICVCAAKIWSYRYSHSLIWDFTIEDVKKFVDKAGGRVIGAAGYNPFKIDESLEEIDKAVKEYGFKFVYLHSLGFGLHFNDKKLYPLYAKCSELNIPVSMQTGHSAEPLPSWVGNPMAIDEVVMDFPDLKINLSHTGWPWVREWCDMVWKHPTVYGDISAYMPKSLEAYQQEFITSGRGMRKVMWGTNGMGLFRGKKELMEMEIKDDIKVKILRENAIKFLSLDK
jgi:predicted TIM-barrel fold metal-dependent hydrolase